MMKHLQEEKDGFRSVIKIVKLFLLTPFLAATLYSQININGFVEITSLSSAEDASIIISAAIDSDSENDFLLTSSTTHLYLHLSSGDYKLRTIKTPYNISAVKRVRKVSDKETLFVFISRKDRVFGTFIINDKGRLGSLQSVKLNYYPDNFILTRTGRKALIYGNNYNGLTLIDVDFINQERLDLQKGTLIENALFYDFDNDSNTDIVYYDIFSESLNIIRNESNYQLDRINFSKSIPGLTKLRKYDFDFDGFEDVLYAGNEGIKIFYGDSVTTFETAELLIRENNIIDFQVGDFNKDGYSDIVYLKSVDNENSQLFISFSSSNKLSKPILVSGVNYIKSFDVVGWRKNKIVCLTGEGGIVIISPINKIENTSLRLGVSPRKIFSFKSLSNNLAGLAVIDSSDYSVKLYLNALSKYYEFRLKKNHSSIVFESIDESSLGIAAFTEGSKLIEFIKLDLTDGSTWSKQFYTKNNIIDLIIEERESNLPVIIVLSEENGKIIIEEFEYKNIRYQKSQPNILLTDILTAKLTGHRSVVYVKVLPENKLAFGEKYFKDSDGMLSYEKIIDVNYAELLKLKINSFQSHAKANYVISFSTSTGNQNYLVVNNEITRMNINNFIEEISDIPFVKNPFSKCYYSDGNKIYSAELNLKNGRVQAHKEIADYTGSFVIELVNENYGYIFMLNNKMGLTEIKLLNE